MRRRATAALVVALLIGSTGVALAHTGGGQSLRVPKPPKPFHGGLFFGTAKTVCDAGAYGEACETSIRVVKVTAQARYFVGGDVGWSRWENVTDEKEFYCIRERTTDGQLHCKDAQTVGMVQHDCVFAVIEYRVRSKGGYKNNNGIWNFSNYKYSDTAKFQDCS